MMIVSQKLRSSSDVITMNKKTLNVNVLCIPRGWLRNSCRKIKRFYLKLRRRLRYKLQAKKISSPEMTSQTSSPTPAPLINELAGISAFHFYISHNTPCLSGPPPPPPKKKKKNCIGIVFNSLGTTVIPRRN